MIFNLLVVTRLRVDVCFTWYYDHIMCFKTCFFHSTPLFYLFILGRSCEIMAVNRLDMFDYRLKCQASYEILPLATLFGHDTP